MQNTSMKFQNVNQKDSPYYLEFAHKIPGKKIYGKLTLDLNNAHICIIF